MISSEYNFKMMQEYFKLTCNSINQVFEYYSRQGLAHLYEPIIAKAESQREFPKAIEAKAVPSKIFIVTKQDNNSEGEIKKARKIFCCTYKQCSKCYRSRENLIFHIQNIHFNQKPYKCKLCPNVFSHRNGLNYHMKHVHI